MYRKVPTHLINVAATVRNTQFLGPGSRCVLWVRGCYANCKGCIAPDWQSPMPENFRTITSLLNDLIENNDDLTGITISGGEPFLQAEGLANFLTLAKKKKDIDVLIYSGFLYEKIKQDIVPGSNRLLNLCDVLIDGRYEIENNRNEGLYGSSNQQVHYLTGRMKNYDFSSQQRKVEFRIDRGEIFLVGVPGQQLANAFFDAVNHTRFDIGEKEDLLLQEEINERE